MITSGTAQSGAPLLSSFQSAAPYGFSFRSCRLTLFRFDTVLCGLLLCEKWCPDRPWRFRRSSSLQSRTERRKVCNAACLTHGVIHHRCAGGCGTPEILPTP
nr:MAG TPA: hypothetical protein [Caudoviricetes sp.]